MALHSLDLLAGPAWTRPIGRVTVNRDSPQADGLRAWLDPRDGQIRDLVGLVPAGALSGDARIVGASLGGSALECDGSGDRATWATTPRIRPEILTRWTIDCWFFHVAASSYASIFEIYHATGGRRIAVFLDASDLFIVVAAATGGLAGSGSNPFVTGRWEHLTLTRDVDDVRCYRNGVLHTTRSGMGSDVIPFDFGDLFLGTNPSGGGSDFNGRYASWRLWNHCKSDAAVWGLYDPATRWDLYRVPSTRVFFDVGGAAVTPGKIIFRNVNYV
jgi:hypothetical protein